MANAPQGEVVREHLHLHRTRAQELRQASEQEAERIAKERAAESPPEPAA